jgi:hypothetical protein
MSPSNVDILRQAVDAFNRRDEGEALRVAGMVE